MDGVSVGGEWLALSVARRGKPYRGWFRGGRRRSDAFPAVVSAGRRAASVRCPRGQCNPLSPLQSLQHRRREDACGAGRPSTHVGTPKGRRPYGLRKPTVHPASPAPFPPERERDSRYVEGESAYVAGRRLGAETVKRVDGPWILSAGLDCRMEGAVLIRAARTLRNASRVLALGRLAALWVAGIIQTATQLPWERRSLASRTSGPSQSVHLLRLQSAFAADGGGVAPPLL